MNLGGSLDLGGLQVLVVEDWLRVAEALKELLEVLGAGVTGPVASVSEAEARLAESTPDLAIVSLDMDQGGRTQGLIEHLHARNVRIIITCCDETEARDFSKWAIVLPKPFAARDLMRALRQLLNPKVEAE